MSIDATIPAVALPTWRDRIRRPAPVELVQVHIHGTPKQAAAVARALAVVVTVTGMTHHVADEDHDQAQDGPVIRLDVTCYPPQLRGGRW